MDPYYMNVIYGISLLFAALMLIAAVSDATRFVIPNAVVVAVLALFCGAALMLPFEVRWELHLGALVAALAVGLVAYRFKALGAGDVKLISALALWTVFDHLPALMLYIALAGGALALVLVVSRMLLFSAACHFPKLEPALRARVFRTRGKIPYGVAIAIGGIVAGFNLPHLGLYIGIGTSI